MVLATDKNFFFSLLYQTDCPRLVWLVISYFPWIYGVFGLITWRVLGHPDLIWFDVLDVAVLDVTFGVVFLVGELVDVVVVVAVVVVVVVAAVVEET